MCGTLVVPGCLKNATAASQLLAVWLQQIDRRLNDLTEKKSGALQERLEIS